MLYNQTLEAFRQLNLHGFVDAYTAYLKEPSQLRGGTDEVLAKCAEAEINDRAQRRQSRLLKAATLKFSSACLEDVDYVSTRGIDRQFMAGLANCSWVDNAQHFIVSGATGCGKSWIASAFGVEVIRRGSPVLFYRFTRLMELLEIARADGSLPKLRQKLTKPKLLILDDFGLSTLTAYGRLELLEIIEARSGTGSILITSQLPIEQWHEWIGDPTLADAILDRLLHRAHRLELKGGSLRPHYANLEKQQ
ncbi:IS21-like element helper ATPase IstB [Porticoccus sp. GXU_MW_L64]